MTEMEQADAELEKAVRAWLKVKAAQSVDHDEHEAIVTDDPILSAWVLVAGYTSIELEGMDASATAYGCAEGQHAYTSRGLGMAAVDRWAQS